MAELPPKIPSSSMTTTYQNKWPPAFPPHQRMPPLTNTHGAMMPGPQPPSWVDEFLDFAAVRRGSHRRSMSDSVAFLEVVPHAMHGGGSGGGFDRLDDEQLMSMFNDDDVSPAGKVHLVGPRRQPPSSPSDHNSNNEDEDLSTENNNNNNHDNYEANNLPKSEPGEVESTCEKDELNSSAPPNSDNANQPSGGSDSIDPKRIKRILANRQSAQRSRVRKLHYISELERSVTTLQTEVSVLSPRVAFLDHQRLILNVDNSALKQRIAALAQDKIFKDAHQEALKKEIERLRHIYQQQQNMKMNTTSNNNNNCGANNANATPKPTSDLNMGCTDKEQLMT